MNSIYYRYSKNPQIFYVSDSLPVFHRTQLIPCLELMTALSIDMQYWWPFSLTFAFLTVAS